MNGDELKFLTGQFNQFKGDIRAIIRDEVRKLIDEQKRQCSEEFKCQWEKINKMGRANKVMSFLGGVAGGIASWATTMFINK